MPIANKKDNRPNLLIVLADGKLVSRMHWDSSHPYGALFMSYPLSEPYRPIGRFSTFRVR